jgi:Leucine-rich repeat (LRR) protein
MKFSFSRFLILSVAAILLIPQASAQVVDIPDPNLESAIREVLNLPDEISLTQPEMLRLTWLQALDSGITDLTGLEYATNLKKLELDHNPITDISPIAYLTHLLGI